MKRVASAASRALQLTLAIGAVSCGGGHEGVPGSAAPRAAPSATPPPAATADAPTSAASPTGSSAASSVAALASAPIAPSKTRYVVAAIGDSLTDPKSHGGIYLEVLQQRCPKSLFSSYGVGGNMASMMRTRFLRDVFGEDPTGTTTSDRPAWTHVIILGGLGDVLSNLTAKKTAKSIQRDIGWMVEETHKRHAKVLVLTLPPWAGAKQYDGVRGQMARDVNVWIAAESGRSLDATFDTRPVLSCGQPEKLCDGLAFKDGLHWSREGQTKLGEALAAGPFADCS